MHVKRQCGAVRRPKWSASVQISVLAHLDVTSRPGGWGHHEAAAPPEVGPQREAPGPPEPPSSGYSTVSSTITRHIIDRGVGTFQILWAWFWVGSLLGLVVGPGYLLVR